MTSETFAHVIGRLEADPLWRLALEADPWLALACCGLIGGPEPRLASFGSSEAAVRFDRTRRAALARPVRAA